ncbi:MAG: Mor transcription activator family protein [Bacteroidales bacterium]
MNLITDDMIELCQRELGKHVPVRTAIRSLCAYYGGQQLYFPCGQQESKIADEVRGVIADSVGDADADNIAETLFRFFGGATLYIPLEKTAFRKDIAHEIFEDYDSSTESMRDLCRKYGMSFTQIYRL